MTAAPRRRRTGGEASSDGNGRAGKPVQLRHVLGFETPLAKLEQQIHELEALQAAKRADYSQELRQLRTNYTSLLRKTYENLSAWETGAGRPPPAAAAVQGLRRDRLPRVPRAARRPPYGDDPAIMCGPRPHGRATR
jgi:acetyl-CoA carboxylase alpha subunit